MDQGIKTAHNNVQLKEQQIPTMSLLEYVYQLVLNDALMFLFSQQLVPQENRPKKKKAKIAVSYHYPSKVLK